MGQYHTEICRIMTYADAYLAPLVTTERESRAADDVAALGTFTTDWTERLRVLRVYILICLESSNSQEDAFAAKLKHYRGEFNTALIAARQASAAESGSPSIFAAVGLERA